MANSTFEAIVRAAQQSGLVACGDDVNGPCLQEQHDNAVILFKDYQACQGSWILLPGFDTLPRPLLIVVYSLFFAWIFFGVTIAADRFMAGIEVICAIKKKVLKKNPATGEMVEMEVPVWNWVVANISLMALGTSAPEILLATVETILTLGTTPGELGPSCIVGSAAYNFFMITTVCTLALNAGEVKRIQQFRVFVCTCIFSIWAYIWMYIVYQVSSPGKIEMWEAWVTLGFFPLLLVVAWVVDTEPWKKENIVFPDAEQAMKKQQALAMQEHHNPTRRSILHYRMLVVRKHAGDSHAETMLASYVNEDEHVNKYINTEADAALRQLSGHIGTRALAWTSHAEKGGTEPIIGFGSVHYSVMESAGKAKVVITRCGNLDTSVEIRYTTKDGTAVHGLDYEHVSGVLTFEAGEEEKEIEVNIVDDDLSEPDVTFTVEITSAENATVAQKSVPVTIIDDDEGGALTFEVPSIQAHPSQSHVTLPVVRRNGTDGSVSVDWATKAGTAVEGKHFLASKGRLEIDSGCTRGTISVPLVPTAGLGTFDIAAFKVELSNPLGGAILGTRTECRVIITPNARAHSAAPDRVVSKSPGAAEEPFNLWNAWGEQIKEAIVPEVEERGWGAAIDLAIHYISITWKLVLCIIPPAPWLGGYPCFLTAMAMLVGIVAILKEVAELFGCMVGLSNMMTGISLVAMGTSIPDTFASRYAAMKDPDADAAIGNITGSNSVNVFLGLGLPWVIACIYHAAKGEEYIVPAGPLGLSLVVFCCAFAAALAILMWRRYKGGELGGTRADQWSVAGPFTVFYLLFLVLVGTYDSGYYTSKI